MGDELLVLDDGEENRIKGEKIRRSKDQPTDDRVIIEQCNNFKISNKHQHLHKA